MTMIYLSNQFPKSKSSPILHLSEWKSDIHHDREDKNIHFMSTEHSLLFKYSCSYDIKASPTVQYFILMTLHHFFFSAEATYEWLLRSLLKILYCIFLSEFEWLWHTAAEQKKRGSANWDCPLALVPQPTGQGNARSCTASLIIQVSFNFTVSVWSVRFRCFARGGYGSQNVRENRSVWLRQLSFTEMNCWERVSRTSSRTQRTWVLSQLILPSTAMNRCCFCSYCIFVHFSLQSIEYMCVFVYIK